MSNILSFFGLVFFLAGAGMVLFGFCVSLLHYRKALYSSLVFLVIGLVAMSLGVLLNPDLFKIIIDMLNH